MGGCHEVGEHQGCWEDQSEMCQKNLPGLGFLNSFREVCFRFVWFFGMVHWKNKMLWFIEGFLSEMCGFVRMQFCAVMIACSFMCSI